ncbi:hypothetical protein MMC27_008603 [Xylographa pallens]|nr:hypothetical protein [Xylographa pallens]
MARGDELPGVIPVRKRKRDTNINYGGKVWNIVYVLANLFSFKEWPAQEPASLHALSIGEEQSSSIVAAVAWSPTGLAKHKRSVLTVLTSNLLLSLWDPGPNPSEVSSWSRATIVNKYLQAYLESDDASPDLTRKRRRIRSMCWAEKLPKDAQAVQVYGELIAVLNDNHEVIVFNVSSPYTCKQEGWAAEVLSHYSITSESQNLHPSDHEIIWSPWATNSDTVNALLSCKIGADHSMFRVSIKTSVVPDIQEDSRGTIPPSPNVMMTLVEGDHFSELAGPKYSMLCDSKCYLNRPSWDVISGRCCFQEFFCITTHLSQMETFHIHTQVDSSGVSSETLTRSKKPWNLQMRQSECRLQFAKEHNLGKMTSTKTWGLASFGAYIAACVTVHPRTMVEYSMPSTERSTILFGHTSSLKEERTDEDEDEDEYEDENLFFPWEFEPQLRDPLAAHAAPWSMILGGISRPALCRSILSCRLLYSSFCIRLMLGAIEYTMKAPTISALDILAESLNTSLRTETESLDSPEIAAEDHVKIVELINSFVNLRSASEAEIPTTQRLLEYCRITECSKPLLYTSNIYKARCSVGHTWNRCALSFLAIQEPGISKFCDTCGREYRNEQQVLQEDIDSMPVMDVTSGNADSLGDEVLPIRDNEHSLISELFRSHGICIFCEGKFIG